MTTKGKFSGLIRVFISLLFVVGSLYLLKDKWRDGFALLLKIDLSVFAWVALLFAFITCLTAVRLFVILRIYRHAVHFSRVLYMNFIALFFNLFLPSALGGDIVKAYYLSKGHQAKMTIVSSLVIDRVIGLGALVVMATLTLPFFLMTFSDYQLAGSVLLISVLFFSGVFLILNQNLAKRFGFLAHLIPSQFAKQKAKELYEAVTQCRLHPKPVLLGLVISLGIQLTAVVMGYWMASSIGIQMPFMIFMLVMPVTGIASMVPSLGGLGVREATLIYFLSSYATSEKAIAFAMAYAILIYGFGLICGILFALFGGDVRQGAVNVSGVR